MVDLETEESDVLIQGLRLPGVLVRAVREGTWAPPSEGNIIKSVFGDEPEFPEFFGISKMVAENARWSQMSLDRVFRQPISQAGLGVDSKLSLLVGVLGPDMMIVLDYRVSLDDPRVLYLRYSGGVRWVEVASNCTALLDSLQIPI
jgi:hypothetical protein